MEHESIRKIIFDDELRRQKELLDKINFIPFLKEYDYVYELMDAMEGIYTDLPPEFQGCLFNFFSEADVADYLNERYKPTYRCAEQVHYFIGEFK